MKPTWLLKSKGVQFGGCILVVLIIWLMVLPRLSSFEAVSKHMQLMEERGVHAGAMYYTDLEKLPLRPSWIEEQVQLWPE